jgi:FAD/FMN-containing dehydrogenase
MEFQHELAARLEGEVSIEEAVLVHYSSAACHYEIRPRAVVWPRHAEDVEALVVVCREAGVSITARGAGSGVAGQSVGAGVVADFTRHMNRIVEVRPDERTVRVQPGVTLGALNARLAPVGLRFAPDPSSAEYCTIGGMIANNAGGPHSLLTGSTRDHVAALSAVTGAGALLEARPVGNAELPEAAGENGRLARAFASGLSGKRDTIARFGMRTSRNSSGYDLPGVFAGGGVSLPRLLTGSEGTLALVTEATLRLLPHPPARGTALVLFDDLARAGEGVLEALREGPSCAELVSETLLAMLREDSPALGRFVPSSARAMVILEYDAENASEAAAGLERIRRRVSGAKRLASEFLSVTDPGRRAEIWAVRAAASLILSAREGARRNMRFIEDACVPPARLVDFIEGVSAMMRRERIETAVFGHAGDSLIHVNPLMDPDDPGFFRRVEAIASEFTDLVIRCDGTLSGEHGDGRVRTPFLPRRFGPLYPLFGEVKALFDPGEILNPGIIVGAGARGLTDGMRRGPTPWKNCP